MSCLQRRLLSGALLLFAGLAAPPTTLFARPLPENAAGGVIHGSGPWTSAPDSVLLVLAAASLADLLPQVAALWELQGGVPVRFSFDATSRLAPQTLQGVPADLFFSADTRWMDWVEDRGAVLPGTRMDLFGNGMVVVVPLVSEFVPSGTEGLLYEAIRNLAMAGENVPAGRYGKEALEATGVWEGVEDKVVRAGNVRGALEWVALGEAQAGIVYRTDARSEPRVEIAFEFEDGTHPPIIYPVAVLQEAPNAELARAFLAFLGDPGAVELTRAVGFRPLEDPSVPSVFRQGASPGLEPPVPSSGGELAVPPLANPWSAIRLSFLVALGATVAGLIPAVWLGWILARKEFLGKSLIATLILAPLVLPPVVTGFLLLSLLGTQSPLGAWLAQVGLPIPFTLLGATLAALTVGLPLYVVSVRNAFQAVDPSYEEVSWTLGRHPWPTFLRVTLPLALPGIAAGAVLAFARALGEFGATVVLAGNVEGSTRTVALAVYTLLESPHGREAIWVLVGASVALSLLALLGYEILSRRQRKQMEIRHGRQ